MAPAWLVRAFCTALLIRASSGASPKVAQRKASLATSWIPNWRNTWSKGEFFFTKPMGPDSKILPNFFETLIPALSVFAFCSAKTFCASSGLLSTFSRSSRISLDVRATSIPSVSCFVSNGRPASMAAFAKPSKTSSIVSFTIGVIKLKASQFSDVAPRSAPASSRPAAKV